MNSPYLYPVASVPTTHFLEGLAIHQATPMYNVPGVPPFGNRRFRIRAIEILAIDNFAPVVSFFGSAAGLTNLVATDGFLGSWAFVTTDGMQIAATGVWRYFIPDLNIAYFDRDTQLSVTPPTLHIVLGNEAATAKVVGAGGALTLTTWLEQTYGQTS
jgi:hypothetical protein